MSDEMGPAIESVVGGLKCDAEGCDYRDDTVTLASYPEWLNKPCPLCGANLLTQKDFDEVNRLLALTAKINSLVGPVKKSGEPLGRVSVDFDGNGISEIAFHPNRK